MRAELGVHLSDSSCKDLATVCTYICKGGIFKGMNFPWAKPSIVSLCISQDAVLHPALPIIIWLMAAEAKGFCLACSHVAACLTFVDDVVCTVVHDPQPSLPSPDGQGLLSKGRGPLGPGDMLAISMRLRAAYGGLSGDVSMLHSYARIWSHR